MVDLNDLFELAKKDSNLLYEFKRFVVKTQQYELAVKIREIEKEFFPPSNEKKEAKQDAKQLKSALAMVGLNVEESACWLIYKTFKKYEEVGGKFSVDEAVALQLKKEEYFRHD